MRVRWVKVWVDAMASLTERFRDEDGRVDFEALGREEYAFRHALVTGDFSRSERARDLYDATINEITSRSEAGRKGAEARWSKNTAAAATREGADVSSTGCNHSTADGDTREDSQDVHDGSNAALLESGTSANHYGPRQTEDRQSQTGAGEVTPESVSAKPSPALSKPKKPMVEKHPHGEFQNVMLTDDEYIKACTSIQDCDSMIERMSSYKASSGKKYKSDYAALLNWARRDEERPSTPKATMFKTAADRDREEIQKIADYYAAQERGEKPPMPNIQLVEGL